MHGLMTLLRFFAAWFYSLCVSAAGLVLSAMVGPTRAWLLIRLPWAKGSLALINVRLHVHVHGAARLTGPAIFVCNHESLIDDVVLPAILPAETRFVAKQSLMWVPLWGWMFAVGGALLIDRKNSRRARASLSTGLKRLPKGWSLAIFPEGTRSRSGELQRFKSGAVHLALESGLPIVPMAVAGTRQVVAPDGWLVRGGDVHVVVGEPIDTSAWRSGETFAHVAMVQQRVAALREEAQARLAGCALGELSCARKSA